MDLIIVYKAHKQLQEASDCGSKSLPTFSSLQFNKDIKNAAVCVQ